MATDLASKRLTFHDAYAVIEEYFERGWTDGLPIVPPSEELVAASVEASRRAPDEVLGIEPVRRRRVTVEKVLVNAVMAGCKPEYAPVVLAAVEAMLDPIYNLHGSAASTGGSAVLVIVNGPVRRQLAFNSGVNALGSGHRANATVGRAIRLFLINVCGAISGVLDKTALGHPGKFSFCLAEDEEATDWTPLHVQRGCVPDQSAVTVFAALAPTQMSNLAANRPEHLVATYADVMAAGSGGAGGTRALVISPENAGVFVKAGWKKEDVQRAVYEAARRSIADLKRLGLVMGEVQPGDASEYRRALSSPDDLMVVVAGGGAGPISAHIPPWGGTIGSRPVTRTIR
jgi:hypothetical protein